MTEGAARIHEGWVASIIGDELTTTCSEGKKHRHTVDADTRVTCDGHPQKVADLKVGTPVRVTIHEFDHTVAVAIESGKYIPAKCHQI